MSFSKSKAVDVIKPQHILQRFDYFLSPFGEKLLLEPK